MQAAEPPQRPQPLSEQAPPQTPQLATQAPGPAAGPVAAPAPALSPMLLSGAAPLLAPVQPPGQRVQQQGVPPQGQAPPPPRPPQPGPSQGLLPPLEFLTVDVLQERIDSGGTVDVFTMRPKGCRLQINPPTLPFFRELRFTDTPRMVMLDRPGLKGFEIPHGRVLLLSDLVLIGEQLAPGRYIAGPVTPRDVRLLFPPLAGKFVQAYSHGEPHEHAIRISIMQRAEIIFYMTSEDKKQRYLSAARACAAFAETGRSASVKGARSPLARDEPMLPQNHADANLNTTPATTPARNDAMPTRASPSFAPGSQVTPSVPNAPLSAAPLSPNAFQLQTAAPSAPPSAATTPTAGSFAHSPSSSAFPPDLMPPPPLTDGKPIIGSPAQSPTRPSFRDSPVPALERAMSLTSVDSFPKVPLRDGEVDSRTVSPTRSASRETTNSSAEERAPSRPLPGGMSPLTRMAVFENVSNGRRPSAPNATEVRAAGAEQHTPVARPSTESQRRTLSRSASQPFLPNQAMLPSKMLTEGGRADPEWLSLETDPEPPAPAQDGRRPSFVLCAQMRCKVFLKQSYAQWKSLGNGRLRLYHLQPSGMNQLVVESEKKKILLSTIALIDAIERVGRTGIAVELSDNGHRTGIVYMLHMRSEESALGLFEQLVDGTHRSTAAISRSATALSNRTNSP